MGHHLPPRGRTTKVQPHASNPGRVSTDSSRAVTRQVWLLTRRPDPQCRSTRRLPLSHLPGHRPLAPPGLGRQGGRRATSGRAAYGASDLGSGEARARPHGPRTTPLTGQRSRSGECGARRPAADYRPAKGWFRPSPSLLPLQRPGGPISATKVRTGTGGGQVPVRPRVRHLRSAASGCGAP